MKMYLVNEALVKAHCFAAERAEHRFVDDSSRSVPLADERVSGQRTQHVIQIHFERLQIEILILNIRGQLK